MGEHINSGFSSNPTLRHPRSEPNEEIKKSGSRFKERIDSPWRFRDANLEAEYLETCLQDTVNRVRTTGYIFISAGWTLRLYFIWSYLRFPHRLSSREIAATLGRTAVVACFTVMVIIDWACGRWTERALRRIGMAVLWLSRIAYTVNLAQVFLLFLILPSLSLSAYLHPSSP